MATLIALLGDSSNIFLAFSLKSLQFAQRFRLPSARSTALMSFAHLAAALFLLHSLSQVFLLPSPSSPRRLNGRRVTPSVASAFHAPSLTSKYIPAQDHRLVSFSLCRGLGTIQSARLGLLHPITALPQLRPLVLQISTRLSRRVDSSRYRYTSVLFLLEALVHRLISHQDRCAQQSSMCSLLLPFV